MTLRAGVVDRCLREQTLDRKFRHRVVAVAARKSVALMHRTEPVIARSAFVAGQTGLRLRFDRRSRILRVADDQALPGRLLCVRRARTVAGFADRNIRIGLVRRMQAERVQRVREVLALELMARDADFLADRMRSGRARVRGDDGVGKSRRREQALHVLMRLVAREVRCGQLARKLLPRLLRARARGHETQHRQRESDRAHRAHRRATQRAMPHSPADDGRAQQPTHPGARPDSWTDRSHT